MRPMDPRSLLSLAPAFIRPVLSNLLDRLDRLEAAVKALQEARKP